MTSFSTVEGSNLVDDPRIHAIDWEQHSALSYCRAILGLGNEDVLIVNGALGFSERWRDLLAAGLARLIGRRFEIVVADATWEPRSVRRESTAGPLYGLNDFWSRGLIRLLGRQRTSVCFLSRAEVESFVARTGWPASRVWFTPFMTSIPAGTLAALEADPPERQAMVFSGGNTLRDWDLLTGALADCGVPVRVATRHVVRAWPSNFDVSPCSDEEFHRLAATASVGVLALRHDRVRSCGQQSYLNFLRLGTPVVVNDAPGVRDHLADVPGAFITPAGDVDAMRERVRWILDPANELEVRELVAAGQSLVTTRYSPSAYFSRLADLAERSAPR